MNIRISKKTRRILVLYLAVLVILYIVVFQLPKMSDKFETTQVLENGTLEVSCEATGYIIKDEAVCTAEQTGTIEYKVTDGTVVKKGQKISSIEEADTDKESEIKGKYQDYLDRVNGFELLEQTNKAPVSGIFSMTVDGCEKFFSIDNMEKITKDAAEDQSIKQLNLEREKVNKGEPVFKISSDDEWYILTWIEKEDAKKFEEGEKVRVTIAGDAENSMLDARVQSIKKDGDFYRMVIYLNVYYKDFTTAREVGITVVQSNTTGLIVDNECIVKKDGQEGVYVKTKDGDTYFRPIKIRITDGKQSVIYESIYVNEKYEQVETVSVYQEVLRHPQQALEEDLANE